MKKIRPGFIILFVVLALVIGSVVYVVYRVARASASFTPPEVPLEEQASASSNRLAKALLERLGYSVKTFTFRYNRDLYPVVIRSYHEDDDWNAWRVWLEEGRTLVLLAGTQLGHKLKMAVSSSHPLLENVGILTLNPALNLEDFNFPFDNSERVWVVTHEKRPVIMADRVGRGQVVYVADATVFADDGVLTADNGYFLNNCVKSRFPGAVVFDERDVHAQQLMDNQNASSEPAFILFRGHFLPLFLHMVFLGILFCLIFWKRFGPARDLEQFSKRTLLLHLTAAGNFYEKTKNPAVFADILDRFFLFRLRDLLHVRGGTAKELEERTKKRLDLSMQDEDAFAVDHTRNLVARDDRRERIILRLKGVERYHGKNKNTG